MRNIFKVIVLIVVVLFLGIQFFRPAKNEGMEVASHQITAVQHTPTEVQQILKVSCYDCHSNTTHYPWYNRIQPVAWFLKKHIDEGKEELNFSEFATYTPYRRYKKLKEIREQIKEDEMPLLSYTIPHRDAVLSTQKKQVLINWAAGAMKEMEAQFPAGSLQKSGK